MNIFSLSLYTHTHTQYTLLFQKVVNLVDSDSSIDEPEDVEELEDITESFNVEDDIFIDDVKSTKVERLSECVKIRKQLFSFSKKITYVILVLR